MTETSSCDRRLMGFWQRVPDETEAVDFCVESLGWVGLGWFVWLVCCCFLLSFFVLFWKARSDSQIRCVKPCVGPQGFSPLPLQTLCLSWSPNSWVFVTLPKRWSLESGLFSHFGKSQILANLGFFVTYTRRSPFKFDDLMGFLNIIHYKCSTFSFALLMIWLRGMPILWFTCGYFWSRFFFSKGRGRTPNNTSKCGLVKMTCWDFFFSRDPWELHDPCSWLWVVFSIGLEKNPAPRWLIQHHFGWCFVDHIWKKDVIHIHQPFLVWHDSPSDTCDVHSPPCDVSLAFSGRFKV